MQALVHRNAGRIRRHDIVDLGILGVFLLPCHFKGDIAIGKNAAQLIAFRYNEAANIFIPQKPTRLLDTLTWSNGDNWSLAKFL
jgi:hypothetical protein